MKRVVKDIIYLIIGIILAGLIMTLLFSCSPEKRAIRKIAKLERDFPKLFETKHDTVFQDRIIEDSIVSVISTNNIEFDSLLIEFQTLRQELHFLESNGFINERNLVELEQAKYRLQAMKERLREGAFVQTSTPFESEDGTVSFTMNFDPKTKKQSVTDFKTKDRVITKTKTIKIPATIGDAFSKIWWVFLIPLLIIILLLFKK